MRSERRRGDYVRCPMVARPLGAQPVDNLGGWELSETGLLVPPRPTPEVLRSGLPIAVGLFSGAGGFDLGIHQAGFHVVASSDSWATAALTYLHNLGEQPLDLRFVEDSDRQKFEKELHKAWGTKKGEDYPERIDFVAGGGWLSTHLDHERGTCAHHIEDLDGRLQHCDTYHAGPAHRHGCRLYWLGDVRKLTGADFLEPLGLKPGDVDLVVGGPPCQGFSNAGRRNVMDPRNSLVFEFTRLVAEIQPKAFAMENVPGMASMITPGGINVIDALALDLDARGYGVRGALSKTLRASAGIGTAVKSRGDRERDRRAAEAADVGDEPAGEEQLELGAVA